MDKMCGKVVALGSPQRLRLRFLQVWVGGLFLTQLCLTEALVVTDSGDSGVQVCGLTSAASSCATFSAPNKS